MYKQIILIILLITNYQRIMSQEIVRKPAVAGSFYPKDKDELKNMIDAYLNNVHINNSTDNIQGIVSPHAGYVFSGQSAAYAYKSIQSNKYDVAVIIAPSHQKYFEGASVFNGDYYETPLGKIKVDKEFAELLTDNKSIVLSDLAHIIANRNENTAEHSLEVQLPFLQTVQPDLPIVPIVMGSQDYTTIHRLVKSLINAVNTSKKKVLFIASSDLSHFHNLDTAKSMDSELINAFNSYDYFKIELFALGGSWEACGAAPISVVMQVCELLGANSSASLNYSTSADSKYSNYDKSRVVGYFSGAIVKDNLISSELLPELTDADKANILLLAKNSVENTVNRKQEKLSLELNKYPASQFPAFVTINKREESGEYDLRACMGHIVGSKNLQEEIISTAQMAATEDYRFGAIKPAELSELKYDVTILSRFKKILSMDEIEIGKHGIYIRKGRNSGLFLPQVATDNHWGVLQYLQNICYKAQLPANAYLDPDSELFIFEAIVIEQ